MGSYSPPAVKGDLALGDEFSMGHGCDVAVDGDAVLGGRLFNNRGNLVMGNGSALVVGADAWVSSLNFATISIDNFYVAEEATLLGRDFEVRGNFVAKSAMTIYDGLRSEEGLTFFGNVTVETFTQGIYSSPNFNGPVIVTSEYLSSNLGSPSSIMTNTFYGPVVIAGTLTARRWTNFLFHLSTPPSFFLNHSLPSRSSRRTRA